MHIFTFLSEKLIFNNQNNIIFMFNQKQQAQQSKAKVHLYDNQHIPQQILTTLQLIQHSTVHIFGMQWKIKKISNYIGKIKQWDIPQRLNISNNKEPKILQQISNIQFPRLKVINLDYNLIYSLEGLCSIYMPALQVISLNDNYISNISTLRRCYFSQLSKISLSGNRIIEFRCFQAMYAPKLREIIVDKDVSKVQGYDACWFMKISPLGIFQNLSIKSLNRIKQQSLLHQIQRKYPYLIM